LTLSFLRSLSETITVLGFRHGGSKLQMSALHNTFEAACDGTSDFCAPRKGNETGSQLPNRRASTPRRKDFVAMLLQPTLGS